MRYEKSTPPVVESPPLPPRSLQAKFQGGSEPAKPRLWWLLGPVKDPKDLIILKLATWKLLEPVKSL